VTVGGHLFEVPAQPATWWLSVLMDPKAELLDLFPGCLDDDGKDAVNELLFNQAISIKELYELTLDVIGTNGSREWWIVLRLVEIARQSWHTIGAEMLSRGVDPSTLSLSGWLDVLTLTLMKNIDPKDATMFIMKLEQPPPEMVATVKEPEISAAQFMSMA
jgi:hypothetical protein